MAEEEPEDVEKLLWVEDPDHAWLLAEKTEDDGAGTVTCVIRPPFSGSKTFMMTDKNCCGVDPSHIDPAQFDIAQMNNMSEAPLIAMLRRRLYTGRIYTLVSDVLIAVNPYCYIKNDVYPDGINTRDNVPDRYMKGSEPHVFQTADNAFRQMSDQGNKVRDQSAIVSGESGAGKTVACKCVMEYLAILTGLEKKARGIEEPVGDDAPKSMEDLILNCNPFLEAFGNAKTNMNDNSSRFGKFIKMLYNSSMICGGAMEQYLLEKARLVFQGPGERNYHVFYFLAKGMTPEEKTTLGLKEPEEYKMLTIGNCTKVATVDDVEECGEMRSAMTAVGIAEETQWALWETLVALLEMGDWDWIDVEEGDKKADVTNKESVVHAAELLGVPSDGPDGLLAKLSIKLLITPGNVMTVPLSKQQSFDASMALIKTIYGLAFIWLVDMANTIIAPTETPEQFIGILDIFGFEIFERNSFEQLCINFANEKLQGLFNHHVFELEQVEYNAEGVDWSNIPFRDNKPCVHLVEKGTKFFQGILPRLDEKSKIERDSNTDEAYGEELMKWFKTSKQHEKFLTKNCKKQSHIDDYLACSKFFKGPKFGAECFTLMHFAGPVTYFVEGFLEKNKDKLYDHLKEMMAGCGNPFAKELFAGGGGEKKKKKGPQTIATKFKAQLKQLTDTLEATMPHYVRCVKPNDKKLKFREGIDACEAAKMRRQLLYAGVMETIAIRKLGYPVRELYADFWNRCCKMKWNTLVKMSASDDPRAGTEKVVSAAIEAGLYVMGKTKVFGKGDMLADIRGWHQGIVVKTIQLYCKARVHRTKFAAWLIESMKKKMAALIPDLEKIQSMARALPSAKIFLSRVGDYSARCAQLAAESAEALAIEADKSAIEAWEEANREKLVSVKAAEAALAAVDAALAFGEDFSERVRIAIFDAENAEKIAANNAADAALACARAAADLVAVLAKQAEEEAEEARLEKEFAVQRAQMRAIGLVQACFLAALTRRRVHKELQHASAVQRQWRWVRAQNALRRHRRSVQRAQAVFRGFNTRRVMFKKRNAARKIAACFEGLVAKAQFNAWVAEMSAACKKGDAQLVKQVLARTDPQFSRIAHHPVADMVGIRDKVTGATFLHAAAASGDLKTLRALGNAGARVDVLDAQGNTPLHALCALGGSMGKQQSILIEIAVKQDVADTEAAEAAQASGGGGGGGEGGEGEGGDVNAAGAGAAAAAGGSAAPKKPSSTKQWLLSCVNSTGETVLDVLDAVSSSGGGEGDSEALAETMKALVSAGAASADGGDPLAELMAEQEEAAAMGVAASKARESKERRRYASSAAASSSVFRLMEMQAGLSKGVAVPDPELERIRQRKEFKAASLVQSMARLTIERRKFDGKLRLHRESARRRRQVARMLRKAESLQAHVSANHKSALTGGAAVTALEVSAASASALRAAVSLPPHGLRAPPRRPATSAPPPRALRRTLAAPPRPHTAPGAAATASSLPRTARNAGTPTKTKAKKVPARSPTSSPPRARAGLVSSPSPLRVSRKRDTSVVATPLPPRSARVERGAGAAMSPLQLVAAARLGTKRSPEGTHAVQTNRTASGGGGGGIAMSSKYFVDPYDAPKVAAHRGATRGGASRNAATHAPSKMVEEMTPKEQVAASYEYVDKRGVCQGPFSAAKMASWFDRGLLPQDLKLRRTGRSGSPFEVLSSMVRSSGATNNNPFY